MLDTAAHRELRPLFATQLDPDPHISVASLKGIEEPIRLYRGLRAKKRQRFS